MIYTLNKKSIQALLCKNILNPHHQNSSCVSHPHLNLTNCTKAGHFSIFKTSKLSCLVTRLYMWHNSSVKQHYKAVIRTIAYLLLV